MDAPLGWRRYRGKKLEPKARRVCEPVVSVIPSWVPKNLKAEYRDWVRLYGEFRAAQWAREAKKEGAQI